MIRGIASRSRRLRAALLIAMTALFGLPFITQQAHAALGAVGAVNAATGFPLWYQDANGLQLAECTEAPCPAVRPDTTQPLAFPGNFPAVDEDFYWAGWSTINLPNGGQALLVQSVLGAFLPTTADGNQIAFGRIRLRARKVLTPGASYTFTYPYGTKTITADALGSVNDTVDVGCLAAPCAANFGAALATQVGPFLTWDPAVAPAPPAGFIGDFNVPHPVVGSPTGNNFFRIDGPNIGGLGVNTITTNQFQVGGRLLPGPIASVAPAAVQFASQQIGVPSATQNVVLTNSGALTLNVSSTALAGVNAADFRMVTNGCAGAALASGASCTIAVGFTPSGVGTRTAALNIVDNAPGSPRTIALSGLGSGAFATASTSRLDFGSHKVETISDPQVLTVTNSGNANLVMGAVDLVGSSDFIIGTDTCAGATLAAGASCATEVSFAPTGRGARTANLSYASNAVGSPLVIPVAGRGIAAVVSFSPTSTDFGSTLMLLTSVDRNLTITNRGDAALAISNIIFSGANAGDFSLVTNGCGSVLAAGANCTLVLRFTPGFLGARSAALELVSDAPSSSPRTVGLTGSGSLLII